MKSQANGIGNYRRTKSVSGIPGSRYREEYGPGNTKELWRWLDSQVKAGLMSDGDRQRRAMLGR
ncbi:MAG: hypothetical protein ACRYFS_17335 [Janthinobacterium lividum]